jgi:hypothetical protein
MNFLKDIDYLKDLPEGAAQTADWALKLNDGTLLPVHSQMLYTVSPVLAGLVSTRSEENSKSAVEVPCAKPRIIAIAFLRWLYQQEIVWTLNLAKELASLSNLWNIIGKIDLRCFLNLVIYPCTTLFHTLHCEVCSGQPSH